MVLILLALCLVIHTISPQWLAQAPVVVGTEAMVVLRAWEWPLKAMDRCLGVAVRCQAARVAMVAVTKCKVVMEPPRALVATLLMDKAAAIQAIKCRRHHTNLARARPSREALNSLFRRPIFLTLQARLGGMHMDFEYLQRSLKSLHVFESPAKQVHISFTIHFTEGGIFTSIGAFDWGSRGLYVRQSQEECCYQKSAWNFYE